MLQNGRGALAMGHRIRKGGLSIWAMGKVVSIKLSISIWKHAYKTHNFLPILHAPCPMPYAPCPMPYALCPMPHAPCPTTVSQLLGFPLLPIDTACERV